MESETLTALVGRNALVEGRAMEASGTVARVEHGCLAVACDPDDKLWPDTKTLDVTVSVFAADALYRFEGPAAILGQELTMEPGALVERIQRRRWPRRRLDMPVTVCPVRDGRRVEGIPGRTVDISVGGVCVETLRAVDGGEDTMLILGLPDGTTTVCAARTVAVEDLGDGWRYRLAFQHLDTHDTARLAALMSD